MKGEKVCRDQLELHQHENFAADLKIAYVQKPSFCVRDLPIPGVGLFYHEESSSFLMSSHHV